MVNEPGSPAGWPEVTREDREDLLAVLHLRFGAGAGTVAGAVAGIASREQLDRLILVAANAPSWQAFLNELEAGEAAFRLPGADA